MSDWHTVPLSGSLARVRAPEQTGTPVFLLLHGWTGDEKAMEPFTHALPAGLWVLFRAPYPAPSQGYSWLAEIPRDGTRLEHFQPAIAHLRTWLTELQRHFPQADWQRQHWVGFSQGGAAILAWGLHHPQGIRSLSVLSGFLPRGGTPYLERQVLLGRPVFIAHGTQDSLIPVERARHMAEVLEKSGAQVTYCEDAVGHKVSADCLRRWKQFWQEVEG